MRITHYGFKIYNSKFAIRNRIINKFLLKEQFPVNHFHTQFDTIRIFLSFLETILCITDMHRHFYIMKSELLDLFIELIGIMHPISSDSDLPECWQGNDSISTMGIRNISPIENHRHELRDKQNESSKHGHIFCLCTLQESGSQIKVWFSSF